MKIFINAGHGGNDTGLIERDVNFFIDNPHDAKLLAERDFVRAIARDISDYVAK